jgi:Alpha 1,4-glycosyltransferase conserved region
MNHHTLNMLWVEGSLGYIEQVSLASAIAVGHKVRLYRYGAVTNVPKGVELEDANLILPRSKILQYRENSSYALGANLFRYELLRHGKGLWVDTDVYFLRPIELDSSVIFGWEDERYINNAILYFTPESEVLDLLDQLIKSEPIVPLWWTQEEQELQKNLYLNGQHRILEDLPWATIGPKAITYFAKKMGIDHLAKPCDVFYPIHWTSAKKLFDPNFDYKQLITENTLTVHMWNHLIKDLKSNSPQPGSFIYNVCVKHEIDF